MERTGSEWNKQLRWCRVFLPLPTKTIGAFILYESGEELEIQGKTDCWNRKKSWNISTLPIQELENVYRNLHVFLCTITAI